MRNRTARTTAGVVVLGLLVAACGTGGRTSGTDAARVIAPGPGVTGEAFGDLAPPCGPGSAKGATDKGVTDSTITIGFGDDAGYATSPGLNKEMADAVRAMIEWCNAQGGVNGRTIVGNYYDAKVLDARGAMTQACADKVFMLVGQGWALDSAQEDIRIGCRLSTVPAYSVSAAFAHGPGMVQSMANPGDQYPLSFGYQMATLLPDAVKKTAFVYAGYSATLESKLKASAALPSAGFSFLPCDQVYSIGGEADWKPFATNLKACGVEVVYWVGSPAPSFSNLLAASKQVGFAPKAFITDANNYDSSFAKWNAANGRVGDNVYLRMAFVPFEEAAQSPATRKYLDLLAKSGGKTGLLGVQATASFLLWVTGVKACGSNVTARCVLTEIDKLQDWTAGGLHVPTQPSQNETSTCGILMKLSGGTFERVAPKDKTFDCDPKYQATNLKTDAILAARLDARRSATQFGTFTP